MERISCSAVVAAYAEGRDGHINFGNPVMKEVRLEAERRKVELVIVPTIEAIRLIEKESAANAILHVTC